MESQHINKLISSLEKLDGKLEKSEIDDIAICLKEYKELKELKESLSVKHYGIRAGLKASVEYLDLEYFSGIGKWIHQTNRLPHSLIEIQGICRIIEDAIAFVEEAGCEENTVYPDKLKKTNDDNGEGENND